MAELTWQTKQAAFPLSGVLKTEAVVYPQGHGYPHAPAHNRLIRGENLAVMSALLAEHENRIDLIYTDPPFFTNRHYPARIGQDEDSRRPSEWQLAEGYPDHWPDINAYLDMLYPRLVLMHRLLAPSGTLYLHLDWHANAYARLLLDEIFGAERLLNEIVWVYHGPSPIRSAFNRKHDTILVYTKTDQYTFNVDAVRQPYDKNTVKTFASSTKAGFGKVPDLERGKVPEDWWYFPVVARLHRERTGYPTQKPEALIERILIASSNPGDVVADFFAGSGTTAVVAARLGRKYIANDAGWRSFYTTQSRLAARTVEPFCVQVLSSGESESDLHHLVSPISGIAHHPVRLERSADRLLVILDEELSNLLEYWEVDPDYDGRLFRSAVQVTRERNKKIIQNVAQLPDMPGSRPVCVRWVDLKGEQAQFLLEKPAGGLPAASG